MARRLLDRLGRALGLVRDRPIDRGAAAIRDAGAETGIQNGADEGEVEHRAGVEDEDELLGRK